MSAVRPLTRVLGYSAAKAGVNSFTQWLAVHLATEYSPRIRVNAIAPGAVNTDAGFRSAGKEWRDALEATVPFPFADPEELVGGLIYLTSSVSDWVTGHTLNIDGGWIPRT